jgi:hypothetical protein
MLRFSIRDILWLTILIAVLVGWWLQWRGDVIARHRDAEAIQVLKQQVANARVRDVRIIRLKDPNLLSPLRFPAEMDYQAPPQRLRAR